MRRFSRFLLALAALLTFVGDARAETVREGDAFSLDVRNVSLCVVAPYAKRSPEGCDDVVLDATKRPSEGSATERVIYSAIMHRPDVPDDTQWGVIVVMKLENERMRQPETKDLREFARGLRTGAGTKVAPGRTVRDNVHSTIVPLAGGGKAIRSTFDVDGIPDDAPFADVSQQHFLTYYIPLEPRGAYTITIASARATAAQYAAVGDAAVATAQVASPAKSRDEVIARAIGMMALPVGAVLLVAVVFGIVVAVLLENRRKDAPPPFYGASHRHGHPPPEWPPR